MDQFFSIFKSIFNTKDHTNSFDRKDISSAKGMGILCYLSFLVFIPMFVDKSGSRFLRFHVNQGLILFIVEVLGILVFKVLGAIPLLGLVFAVVGWLWDLIMLALIVFGIMNVLAGKAKDLPFIGNVTLIK